MLMTKLAKLTKSNNKPNGFKYLQLHLDIDIDQLALPGPPLEP